jgi:hypothetical protein
MDLSTMRTEVRDIIGEETADFWSDAELNRYLNESLRRFSGENRWSWLLTEGTGTLYANDPEFILTDGVAEYRHLHFMLTRSGDTRPYLPERVSPARGFQLRTRYYTAQAYPKWFYVTSVEDSDNDGSFWTTVRFIPTPTGDVDITFQYYRTPATLDGDTDVPDVPAQYHKALVHHAAGTAWLKELNGGGKAQEQFQMYEAVVREAVDDEETQSDDTIFIVGGDGESGRAPGEQLSSAEYALLRIAPTLTDS